MARVLLDMNAMSSRIALISSLCLLIAACYDSTRLDLTDAGEEDVSVPDDPTWEQCELIGVDDPSGNDYVIQIRNPSCDSTVCLYYLGDTFCTHRCELNSDCRDVGAGRCSLTITVGEPDMIGSYCVIADH